MSCLICTEYYESGSDVCTSCDLQGLCDKNGEQPKSPCCETPTNPYRPGFSVPVFPNGTFSTYAELGIAKGEIIGYQCSECSRVVARRIDGEGPICPRCGQLVFYIFANRREKLLDGTVIKKGEILGYRCTKSDCNFSVIFTRTGQSVACTLCQNLMLPFLSAKGYLLGMQCPAHRDETTVMFNRQL